MNHTKRLTEVNSLNQSDESFTEWLINISELYVIIMEYDNMMDGWMEQWIERWMDRTINR